MSESDNVSFQREADALFQGKLQPLAVAWKDSVIAADTSLDVMLDTITEAVMEQMAQQEPATSGLRRKWFLSEKWKLYFKDKKCPAYPAERYPFNPPIKLAVFPDIDWTEDTQSRSNASSEVSRFASVCAFAVRNGVKPSEIIKQYGSVRKAVAAFDVADNDDKKAEQTAKEKAENDKRVREAAERKAAREKADAEKAEAKAREKADKEAKDAADQERRAAEAAAKKADKDAADAAAASKKAQEAARKAEESRRNSELRQQEMERKRQEDEAAAARKQQALEEAREAEAKRKAEDEAAEAERKREAEARDKELARIEAEAKERDKEQTEANKPRFISVKKDRDEVFAGLERVWVLLVKEGADWRINSVRPAAEAIALGDAPVVDVPDKPKRTSKPKAERSDDKPTA